MKIRKGNNSATFFTSAGSALLRHTTVGEGGNAESWSDIAESSQGTGDYVNQKPVARWAVPVSDVVEGNTHTVAVVAEHTDPSDSIQAVHFYTDDDQVNPKVATLVDYTSPMTGITYPRWQYTLDTSSWGIRQEREVRAVIIPTNGTTRILQGSTLDIDDTVQNPRTSSGAPGVSEDDSEMNIIAAGLHSCWLYKWDGVTRQITPENLETQMGSLSNPRGVVFTITSDGDVATGLSSAPWTVDVGDQRNSSIKVKSDGTRRTLTHNATFTSENNASIDTAACAMIWQGFEFDKTIQVGSGKKMTFVDIFSDRALYPYNSATAPTEDAGSDAWVEYEAGPNPLDPLHAGETWWCRENKREILLSAASTRVPGNTTTSIVKFGGGDDGVWHFDCYYRHVESIVKRSSACFGVKVEWAWLDTFSNTGCMVGCVSHELPYGFLAATGAQFHNDMLQFIGRNFHNVLYHSSGGWRRSTDSLGIQGQLVHMSDTNGSRAVQDFVMKDIAIIGNAAPGKLIAQNMNMKIPLRNTKWENVTIVQDKLSLADGTETDFDKFTWNFEPVSRVKKSSGAFSWWRSSWLAHSEQAEEHTGTGYDTAYNYDTALYAGERPELFKMKNCIGDGWVFGTPSLGESTVVDSVDGVDRTLQDLYDQNFDTTSDDIATLLFDLFGIQVIPKVGKVGAWYRNGFYVRGASKQHIATPANLSVGSPGVTATVPSGLTGCRELLSGMPDASSDDFWV